MLLYGLPPDDEPPGDGAAVPADDGMTSQQRAAAAVGAALEALVPALDANDDGKLRAAVAFFNSTFCSVVALCSDDPCAALSGTAEAAPGGAGADAGEGGGGEEGLPVGIDLQYWAVEVVERLMEVARTLQAHEGAGGGDDGCAAGGPPHHPACGAACRYTTAESAHLMASVGHEPRSLPGRRVFGPFLRRGLQLLYMLHGQEPCVCDAA